MTTDTPVSAASPSYDIAPATLQAAAVARYGETAKASPPYWVDSERVRVGISLEDGNVCFGADFLYTEGRFA